ncbi:hypothetical protein HF086_000190, partial [Spodoptera exigua]
MNDPQPSTSQKDVDVFLSPRKNRPRKAFTVTEKVMIRNAYKYVKNEISAQLEAFEVVQENECVSKVADILGITSRSVCNVLKEVKKGHTVKKTWVDKKVTSSRQAFLEGLTTGLKNPSGKGKRLIISHIGSEEGFLEEGLMIFEAKKNCEDYHDEMNAVFFEKWFAGVLPKLRPNSIV